MIILTAKELDLNKEKYDFRVSIIKSGHCKEEYVKAMKREFWENSLNDVFEAGTLIGKPESEIKAEISYAMVYIYIILELYYEAYNYLVEQVRGYGWVHAVTVEKIVEKTGCHSALVEALKTRLKNGNLTDSNCSDYLEAKAVLKKLGYWE